MNNTDEQQLQLTSNQSDIHIPLTESEWKELEREGEHKRTDLFDRTLRESEHPEWYDGPCLCHECMSYG